MNVRGTDYGSKQLPGLAGQGVLREQQEARGKMISVNVTVIAGKIAAAPVRRTMPSGQSVVELRVSVPEVGKRSLPLPVSVWDDVEGFELLTDELSQGDSVLVHGKLMRRFYRSGAGARSLMEVVATGVRKVGSES